MKIIAKVVIFSTLSLSLVFSQTSSRNLVVPVSKTKIGILVETIKLSDIISKNEVESNVKLMLRRNGIEYFTDYHDVRFDPLLYINLNITRLKSGDIYGNLNIEFERNPLYEVSHDDYFKKDFNFRSYILEKGRSSVLGAVVWQTGTTFYIPSRYNQDKEIIDILEQYINIFSSAYIDANDL